MTAPASHRSVGNAVGAALLDVRYATRQLRQAPGLSAAIIAVLALGIGANATMFGILDRLLLRPPAHVVDPSRVVSINSTSEVLDDSVFRGNVGNVPAFAELAESSTRPSPLVLGNGERARPVSGLFVSASYFPLTGVRPALGRFILPDEDRSPRGTPVVVLSYDLWQREFAGDSGVVGKTLDLSDNGPVGGKSIHYTVVGVAPRGFTGAQRAPVDLFLPHTANPSILIVGGNTSLYARLRPGVTIAQAEAQANTAAKTQRPALEAPRNVVLQSLVNHAAQLGNPDVQMSLLLTGVSTLVLVIACTNVMNLLLGRALRRRREIAVRVALGISQRRLIGQLLVESLLLAIAGGAGALLIVQWGGALVRAILLDSQAWSGAVVDARVLGFTAAVALATGIVSGLAPALQGRSLDLTRALKEGARDGSARRSRTRAALVLVQAALAVVLLVGTGLFVRSLHNLNAVDLGMRPSGVVVATVKLPFAFDSGTYRANVVSARQAEDRLKRLPGVASVGTSSYLPFSGGGTIAMGMPFRVPGRDSKSTGSTAGGGSPDAVGPVARSVSPDFFGTLGVPIRRGRGFTEADRAARAKVIVVSETVARTYWPATSPIGQCVVIGNGSCSEVIGVAADTRGSFETIRDAAYYYLPEAFPSTSSLAIFVRPTAGDPARWVTPVRRTLQAAMPSVGYVEVQPMAALLEPAVRPRRLGATIFLIFGGLALVLATVGLYSIISYAVAQHIREIGIRIALGARAETILKMVMSQGIKVTVIGVVVGLLGVLATGRFVQRFLYHVSPHDPIVLGSVVAVVCGVAALASFIPARRATRVDPVTVLREE